MPLHTQSRLNSLVSAYIKKGNPLSDDRGKKNVQNLVGKSDVGRAKTQ